MVSSRGDLGSDFDPYLCDWCSWFSFWCFYLWPGSHGFLPGRLNFKLLWLMNTGVCSLQIGIQATFGGNVFRIGQVPLRSGVSIARIFSGSPSYSRGCFLFHSFQPSFLSNTRRFLRVSGGLLERSGSLGSEWGRYP